VSLQLSVSVESLDSLDQSANAIERSHWRSSSSSQHAQLFDASVCAGKDFVCCAAKRRPTLTQFFEDAHDFDWRCVVE
jgi:hypothetical protein